MKNTSHFLALLTKNFYSWRSSKISSMLEILIPVSLVAVLMLIKATNSPESQIDHSEEVFTIAPNQYLTELDASFSLCNFYLSEQSSWGYGLVGSNPLVNYLKKQISAHPAASNLKLVSFSTQQDLNDYIKSRDYETSTKLCFAIQIEEYSNEVIEVSFRSNSSYVFSKKSPLLGAYMDVFNFYRKETATEALQQPDPNFLYQYLSTGFFQIINYVSSFILEKEGINKELTIKVKAMNKTKFKRSSMLVVVKSILPLVIYIGYLIPMCKMI